MNLHYQLLGEGNPLIIIHGLFGSSDNWRSMAKYFAKSFEVINVDLRNHGRSPHHSEQTFELMAADIKAVSDKLLLKPAYIIGHSLGGKVAMKVAELFPEIVAKLIIVDIAPKAYQGEHTPLMDAMMALDLTQFSNRSQCELALTDAVPDKTVRQFLLMNLISEEDMLKWRINLSALKANYRAFMDAVFCDGETDIPSLFIYGEKSDYVTVQDRDEIKLKFTRAKFSSVPAGHWVHAERPQQFKQLVEEFLKDD